MEKLRRKRINNSLDQLRTLLPYSVNMKKDMASLLEQTVEYINIMHTVLNEDKPACLNKVYICYRQKTEQIETFRKCLKKSVNKKSKIDTSTSWGQPYHTGFVSQSSEADSYLKNSYMSTSYYDPLAAGTSNPMWQQKFPDTYNQNHPPFLASGQNHGNFYSVSQPSMPIRYLPSSSSKQCDVAENCQEGEDVSNCFKGVPSSEAKLDSWPLLSGNNQSTNDLYTVQTNPVFSTQDTLSSLPSATAYTKMSLVDQRNSATADWHQGFGGTSALVSKYEKNSTSICDGVDVLLKTGNVQDDVCNGVDEEKASMSSPQESSQMSQSSSTPGMSSDASKSSSSYKDSPEPKSAGVPEIFFVDHSGKINNAPVNLQSNHAGFGSWTSFNSLPPLSLSQHFVLAGTQQQPSNINGGTNEDAIMD